MNKWLSGLFFAVFFEVSFTLFNYLNIKADKADFQRPVQFDYISSEQGLSQNTINCILQDSQGFLWFGTQDGLNKYDGYGFEVFKHHPLDSNTISHNWIWDVYEDHSGNLWIATWRGLNKYDPNLSKFTRYLPESKNPNSINNIRPTSIKEDHLGNLWIGTWGGGLSLYCSDTNKFIAFTYNPLAEESISNNFIRTLHMDSRGFLWIGTWNGLCRINPDRLTKNYDIKFTRYYNDKMNPGSISGNQIFSIHEDSQSRIWVGTMENGLNKFNDSTEKFVRYKHNDYDLNSISSNSISSILEDNFGTLWIATLDQGLNRLLPDGIGFSHFKHQEGNDKSISANNLLTLYEDRSGILWVGTQTSGLNKIILNRKKFFFFNHSKSDTNSLSGKLVRCFYEDERNNLWIGTADNGLNQYNPRTGRFKHFRHDQANSNSLSHNNVQSIISDQEGVLWIGTDGGGLNRFNPKTNHFVCFKHDPDNDQSISSNHIETLLLDNEGSIWVGTSEKGLDRYYPDENKFIHFRFDVEDTNSISTDYILSLFQDSRGNIWIGGWGGGLNRYDSNTNRFYRYFHDPKNKHSLCDNIVNSICETKINGNSKLWVATSGGLSYMNLVDSGRGIFNHVFESDGLANQHIYGILEDRQGHLWLSTNKGISKYTPRGSFKNYDSGDGLPSNEFSGGAYYQTIKGWLYFGCAKGFITFHPDSIINYTYVPPIVINSFKKFNKEVNLDKHISTMDEITLSYKDYVFSFDFSALDYIAPLKNQYAYKMEGFNEDWIYTDARRRSATFTNMDPGKYIFKVRGSNSDGVWNETGTSIKIVILPPLWKTWWFRLLMGFMILGGVSLAHFYRVRHLKLMQKKQMEFSDKLLESRETERKRIAAELHDSLGQNLLIANNELHQLMRDRVNLAKGLDGLSSIIKESLNEVREISHNLHPHLLDRLGITKAIESMINKISHASDITFDVEIENIDNILTKNSEIHYYRIIQEALNNIIKHSESNSCTVVIKKTGNHIRTIIEDTGKGFQTGISMKRGIGLRDMEERTRLMSGNFHIFSKPGSGTRINMDIPITEKA